MVEKIVNAFSRVLFGENFTDGYINDSDSKDEYVLTSLFPNESVRKKAITVLESNKNSYIYNEK